MRTRADGPSASCLQYLFAHRTLKTLTPWQRIVGAYGVRIPGSGTTVRLGALERQLLAVAVWSLLDLGCATVRIGSKAEETTLPPKIGVVAPSLHFTLLLERQEEGPEMTGLEGELLASLPAGECDLYRLAAEWAGERMLPLNGVIVVAQREALQLGVLALNKRSHVATRSQSRSRMLPELVPNRSKLRALERAYSEMTEDLARFATQAALWNTLLAECSAALYSLRPLLNGSGSG